MVQTNKAMLRRLMVIVAMLLAVPAAGAGTVVVVVGAEGEPEFGREFSTWADRWVAAAESSAMRVVQVGRDVPGAATTEPSATTVPAAPTTTLAAATAASATRTQTTTAVASTITAATTTSPTATAPATDKQKLQSILGREAGEKDEPLWLVLIGHGTSDGRDAKFNLRGPDVSDKELAEWLRPLRRPVAAINCSSASGPFLNRLSADGRVVITAARSGSEIQFSRFGQYLSTAVSDPAADLDKDGQTSLLEAFLAASHGVEAFYKQAGRLATEHALLDDNGDALGVSSDWFQGVRATRSARSGASVDGPRAHQWHLVRSANERLIRPELRARRDELELAIESLRQKKSALPEADYYTRLEKLLIDLAHVYQQNDEPK